MLPKKILQTIIYGIGLRSLAAVVYFAGPFIAFGNWRPLENSTVRSIVILLLVAGAAGLAGFSLFRRRKGAKQIADGISGADLPINDEPVLKRGLTDSNRVDLEGKGPDVPIASNATPEGRARNRRVEIFIERSE